MGEGGSKAQASLAAKQQKNRQQRAKQQNGNAICKDTGKD
jgi:hypothetical protein